MQKNMYWRTFLYRGHVLLLLETHNSNINNASPAKHVPASSNFLLQMRRKSVESVEKCPKMDTKLLRARRELVNHATNGWMAARISAIEAPSAAMSIQLDLQHLLHQLHLQCLLLQYLLLHMEHLLHTHGVMINLHCCSCGFSDKSIQSQTLNPQMYN